MIASQLSPNLKRLRLSGILDTLELRTQQATAEQWGYEEFLTRLMQDEVERRAQKQLALRIRRSGISNGQDPRDLRLHLQSHHQPAAGLRPGHL